MAVIAFATANVAVQTQQQATVDVTTEQQTVVTVTPPAILPSLTVNPMPQPAVTIAEVCSVGDGTLTVLASIDGPLHTRDGGFFLLNPEREED